MTPTVLGRKAGGRYRSVLLGEEAASKAVRQGSNPCTPAYGRRGSIEKGGGRPCCAWYPKPLDTGANPVVGSGLFVPMV